MLQPLRDIATKLFSTCAIDEEARLKGIAWYVRNGLFFKTMESLSIGAFLTAYALELGATNFLVGLLAAIPQLAQVVQLPMVPIVERFPSRKFLSVILTLASRLILLLAAGAALISPSSLALAVVVTAFFIRYIVGAMGGCAWNSWMRDFLPKEERGVLVARRMTMMTIASAVIALIGGIVVDHWHDLTSTPKVFAYGMLLVFAATAGALEAYAISRIPEEPRKLAEDKKVILRDFWAPLKEKNFRTLLLFLLTWNFAVNLAAPFFTVHMLQRIGLSLTTVMILTSISQFSNAAVMGTFGVISDKISNKRVLHFAAPLFIACIFAWTFTTLPKPHTFTLPLLIVIHFFTGIATAGVTLAISNIAIELAPEKHATNYLAMSAVVIAIAAGIAPIIGGLYVDVLANYEVTLTFNWKSPNQDLTVPAFDLSHWDFYFLIATFLGLWALTYLDKIVEPEGEGNVRMTHELMMSIWRGVQTISSVAGLKGMSDLPIALAIERWSQRRNGHEVEDSDKNMKRQLSKPMANAKNEQEASPNHK